MVNAQQILAIMIVINLIKGGQMWKAAGRRQFHFITEKHYFYLSIKMFLVFRWNYLT